MVTEADRNHIMETPFGVMEVVANGPDRIHLRANGPMNVPAERKVLTVNGVEYGVTANFKRDEDGIWVLVHDGLLLSRANSPRYGDYTVAAFRKVRDGLVATVNEWAASQAGNALLAIAEVLNRARDIAAAEERVMAARAELSNAEQALAELTFVRAETHD